MLHDSSVKKTIALLLFRHSDCLIRSYIGIDFSRPLHSISNFSDSTSSSEALPAVTLLFGVSARISVSPLRRPSVSLAACPLFLPSAG